MTHRDLPVIDVDAADAAMKSLALSIGAFARASRRAAVDLRYAIERKEAFEEYRAGLILQGLDPERWGVFCVTTDEGRCRVVSRPRGGWA